MLQGPQSYSAAQIVLVRRRRRCIAAVSTWPSLLSLYIWALQRAKNKGPWTLSCTSTWEFTTGLRYTQMLTVLQKNSVIYIFKSLIPASFNESLKCLISSEQHFSGSVSRPTTTPGHEPNSREFSNFFSKVFFFLFQQFLTLTQIYWMKTWCSLYLRKDITTPGMMK